MNIVFARPKIIVIYENINKADCHEITEILLKMALNTIK